MVRFSTFSVVALFAIASLATPIRRIIGDVQKDIANITAFVSTLDTQITAYPNKGGTLAGALTIHMAATGLISTVKSTTADVQKTGDVSEVDGQANLKLLLAMEPTITHALAQVAGKRPAFDALPLGHVSALVKQDLTNLKSNVTDMANALVKYAPADLKAPGIALRDRLSAACVKAMAAYASA